MMFQSVSPCRTTYTVILWRKSDSVFGGKSFKADCEIIPMLSDDWHFPVLFAFPPL